MKAQKRYYRVIVMEVKLLLLFFSLQSCRRGGRGYIWLSLDEDWPFWPLDLVHSRLELALRGRLRHQLQLPVDGFQVDPQRHEHLDEVVVDQRDFSVVAVPHVVSRGDVFGGVGCTDEPCRGEFDKGLQVFQLQFGGNVAEPENMTSSIHIL